MASKITSLFPLFLLLQTILAVARSDVLHPHCQERCGNFRIPYPFGIGPDCYRDKNFEITCKQNEEGFMSYSGDINSTLQVFSFSVSQSQATMLKHLRYNCYNASGLMDHQYSGLNLSGTPFTISAAKNKFTAIGCDTVAYIAGNNNTYISGCMAFCNANDLSNMTSGSCTGTGCCQVSIPENLVDYHSEFSSRSFNGTWKYNPCSYSVVAEQDWFKFDVSYLKGNNFKFNFHTGVPLVLDWVAGNVTCEEAMKDSSSYACRSSYSNCTNSPHGRGYTCNCSQGYEGNPYLDNGCHDIDECSLKDQHPCPQGAYCTNTLGNYTCACLPGYYSEDPRTKNCVPKPSLPLWIKLALGIGVSIISLLILSFWLCVMREKRMLAEEKKRFFQQNGGLLLYEKLRSKHESASLMIYRKEDLEKATNNFDKNLILGHGGHGTVYRGTLEGNLIVAIKKAKTIDASQKEEFVKEILILSQINHNNVVKLLGCCLEVEVPMLVYEFVFNGTLHDYIHDEKRRCSISFDTRLRIAIESAEALAYLHSAASPPILHRDVKSSNILLDENYAAKVSDFGASILVAMDKTQLASVLQGTLGYLDPEYMQTYIFTEKSDVYGFGVVLLELLTRKKAIYFQGPEVEKSLASSFISSMKQGRLMECLDDQIIKEGHVEVLQEISELVMQCLSIRGEERPTMKEVAEGLQRLRRFTQHPWGQHNPEELESLLVESSSYNGVGTAGFCSLENRPVLNIESGR